MLRQNKIRKQLWFYLAIFLITALWSGYNSFDPVLWWLEAGICIVGVVILVYTYRRFQFTGITYFFILFHLIILLVGAHYSYARVPLFDWLSQVFNWSRNNYDKLGHFAQGFIPAMIARELMIRLEVIKKRSWFPFLVICICLAISAFYELIEWWVALLSSDSAEDFLGMQGYVWDTQSDMFCAMLGAICMLLFFSKIQDKQIDKIRKETE